MVKASDVKVVKKLDKSNPDWIHIEVLLKGKKFSFGLNDAICNQTVLVYEGTEFTEITLPDGQNWRVETTDSNGYIYDIRRKDYK